MARAAIFLLVVFVFGALQGVSIFNLDVERPVAAFAEGYFFNFLLWGAIYFNALILGAAAPARAKLALVFLLAAVMGLVTYFFYTAIGKISFGEPVMVQWDEGGSPQQLPMSTGVLLPALVTFLYLFLAASLWFSGKFLGPPRKSDCLAQCSSFQTDLEIVERALFRIAMMAGR